MKEERRGSKWLTTLRQLRGSKRLPSTKLLKCCSLFFTAMEEES